MTGRAIDRLPDDAKDAFEILSALKDLKVDVVQKLNIAVDNVHSRLTPQDKDEIRNLAMLRMKDVKEIGVYKALEELKKRCEPGWDSAIGSDVQRGYNAMAKTLVTDRWRDMTGQGTSGASNRWLYGALPVGVLAALGGTLLFWRNTSVLNSPLRTLMTAIKRLAYVAAATLGISYVWGRLTRNSDAPTPTTEQDAEKTAREIAQKINADAEFAEGIQLDNEVFERTPVDLTALSVPLLVGSGQARFVSQMHEGTRERMLRVGVGENQRTYRLGSITVNSSAYVVGTELPLGQLLMQSGAIMGGTDVTINTNRGVLRISREQCGRILEAALSHNPSASPTITVENVQMSLARDSTSSDREQIRQNLVLTYVPPTASKPAGKETKKPVEEKDTEKKPPAKKD